MGQRAGMKWLLDENLSHRIVRLIPDPVIVTSCTKAGLLNADDRAVWRYAATNGMMLVTKDDDFRQLAIVQGPPPKVVWLNVGNAGTDQIARLLLNHLDQIQAFDKDPDASLLVVG